MQKLQENRRNNRESTVKSPIKQRENANKRWKIKEEDEDCDERNGKQLEL